MTKGVLVVLVVALMGCVGALRSPLGRRGMCETVMAP